MQVCRRGRQLAVLGQWPRGQSTSALPGRGGRSSVFLGRQYEVACQRLLRTIGIDSRLMGGPNDGGVDLQGAWYIGLGGGDARDDAGCPVSLGPIPVVAQCKYIAKDCPPVYVRELEGTLGRWAGTVGLLIASHSASRACVETIFMSPMPLLFLHYDMERVRKAVTNAALHRRLPDLVIGSRHVEGGLVEPIFMVKG